MQLFASHAQYGRHPHACIQRARPLTKLVMELALVGNKWGIPVTLTGVTACHFTISAICRTLISEQYFWIQENVTSAVNFLWTSKFSKNAVRWLWRVQNQQKPEICKLAKQDVDRDKTFCSSSKESIPVKCYPRLPRLR